MTTPLSIKKPRNKPVEVRLEGIWTVAEATELHRKLREKLPSGAAWALHAEALEVADLAVWQVLHRFASHREGFTAATPTPCLDRLSADLGLPAPSAWEPAANPTLSETNP